MLRALEPDDSPRPAYLVPWHVERSDPRHPVVVNSGLEALDFVRLFADGPEVAATEHWGQILPAETVALCFCEIDTADLTMTLVWFRPETGEEYCWRFVV
ncbi:hypothetical protein [Microbacterium sp.]|uniref:hypothetical protein n=1 Tax=Microbacterium sp. TaxID=51671 RepID=UPI003F703422